MLLFQQSLDYEICENALYLRDHKFREAHFAARTHFARWILFILIGNSYISLSVTLELDSPYGLLIFQVF